MVTFFSRREVRFCAGIHFSIVVHLLFMVSGNRLVKFGIDSKFSGEGLFPHYSPKPEKLQHLLLILEYLRKVSCKGVRIMAVGEMLKKFWVFPIIAPLSPHQKKIFKVLIGTVMEERELF